MGRKSELFSHGASREQALDNALETILTMLDEESLVINSQLSAGEKEEAESLLAEATELLYDLRVGGEGDAEEDN